MDAPFPFALSVPPKPSFTPYNIAELQCASLTNLFHETTAFVRRIRIELVSNCGRDGHAEGFHAAMVDSGMGNPTIRLVSSLHRREKIEAIAHELGHLLMVYRWGLRMIHRRVPRPRNEEKGPEFFLNEAGNLDYLVGQLGNTIHHLIMVGCLKEKYGIESALHLRLLSHSLKVTGSRDSMDKESLHVKGIIAFEYEKLSSGIEERIDFPPGQSFLEKAYHSAGRHFGGYGFPFIPPASSYEGSIFSFLRELGYHEDDFTFL